MSLATILDRPPGPIADENGTILHLKEGVDLESFKILNLIYQTVVPLGIKFNQQLFLYPNGDRLDRVTISFSRNDYMVLNKKLETGDINN